MAVCMTIQKPQSPPFGVYVLLSFMVSSPRRVLTLVALIAGRRHFQSGATTGVIEICHNLQSATTAVSC